MFGLLKDTVIDTIYAMVYEALSTLNDPNGSVSFIEVITNNYRSISCNNICFFYYLVCRYRWEIHPNRKTEELVMTLPKAKVHSSFYINAITLWNLQIDIIWTHEIDRLFVLLRHECIFSQMIVIRYHVGTSKCKHV